MDLSTITIIGIDCATEPKKVGLAKARLYQGRLTIDAAQTGTGDKELAQLILEWIPDRQPTLLALDAPLGWPDALGAALATHQAGMAIERPANQLFRRETDRFIKAQTGKQPLDVGADRIARTATAALHLLSRIRQLTGQSIPLAWVPNIAGLAAIEVYPAGTLTGYGLTNGGYKDVSAEHRHIRASLIEQLPSWVAIAEPAPLIANADILDAALCCLAGANFLQGNCYPPVNEPLAHKEGWIWVQKTG